MEKTFLVEVSARHVHLNRAAMDALFGEGTELTNKRDLSQPGQFLCEERVDVIGPKKTMSNLAILGPLRPQCQLEISVTDGFALGTPVPVRESGDVEGTPALVLRGPKGEITVPCGSIAAKRHIHMTPEDAKEFGVEDKQIVEVRVDTERPVTFGDVVVRVSPKFALAMHVDTDEANASLIGRNGCQGYIVKK
ncbi:MAG: phosphate propanoyltransferase [Eubacteriales bacterium]|nr:phosphate propanoyltransferase [Eubacteriales bacterium]